MTVCGPAGGGSKIKKKKKLFVFVKANNRADKTAALCLLRLLLTFLSPPPPPPPAAGVLMVYFSGYLIETTGSWATVFALITTVNLLGLCTFLAFAEARRVDIVSTKVRHNIHI